MKLFGSLTELVSTVFRRIAPNNTITVQPGTNTANSGNVVFNLPPKTSGTSEIVDDSSTQTLTAKTLTSPVITTPTGITKSDVGLANVDNTSDASKNAATVTLTNKKLDDSTTTVTDTADPTKVIKFDAAGTTGTSTTLTSSQTANRVLTLPDVTDTLVGKTTTDTLTNKTLTNPVINAGSGTVVLPQPGTAPTTEGEIRWNATNDLLQLGTGAGTKTMVDTDSAQTLSAKTLTSPTINSATVNSSTLTNPTVNAGSGIVVLPQATTPAQTAEGSVVWDTDDDLLTIGTGSGRKTLLNTDSIQVITNKDIDGGTAANTSRITLPKETTTILNGLGRKEGTLVYDTTTGQVKFDNGTVLSALATTATATPTTQGNVTSYFPVVQSSTVSSSSATITALTTTDGVQAVFATGTGAQTISIPSSGNTGRVLQFKKTESGGSLVITPASGTIDGAASLTLSSQNDSVALICNGTNWFRISDPAATASVAGNVSTGTQTFAGIKNNASMPACSVQVTGTTNHAKGSNIDSGMTWTDTGGANFDQGNVFTTGSPGDSGTPSAGIFTVPTGAGGIYEISARMNWAATNIVAGNVYSMRFYKNASVFLTDITAASQVTSTALRVSGSFLVQLSSGDIVFARARSTANHVSSAATIGDETYFSIAKLY